MYCSARLSSHSDYCVSYLIESDGSEMSEQSSWPSPSPSPQKSPEPDDVPSGTGFPPAESPSSSNALVPVGGFGTTGDEEYSWIDKLVASGEDMVGEFNRMMDIDGEGGNRKRSQDEASQPSEETSNPANEDDPYTVFLQLPRHIQDTISQAQADQQPNMVWSYCRSMLSELPVLQQQHVLRQPTKLQSYKQMVRFLRAKGGNKK